MRFQTLDVTWTDWKVFAARANITTYYLQSGSSYEVIAIDPRFVYKTFIIIAADISDFTTNYLSSGTAVTSIDDAIALANKLQTVNSVEYDTSNNPIAIQAGSAISGSQSGVPAIGTDGTNARILKTDSSGNQIVTLTGTNIVRIEDTAGNTLTSTSSALDVNLKSQTNAIKVSKSTADNAVANPLFVELSDGSAAFGVTGNPIFVNLKDGSGNALTSTSNKLDVGLTGANTVKLNDGSGNSLSSTSNALNVSLRDSAGTAVTLNTGGNLKNTIYDASGNVAVGTKGSAFPGTAGVVIVGGTDGTNTQAIATTTGGLQKVALSDGSANSITSTSSALDVNLKSVTGTNVPISIAAQTLTAVQVSPTTAANTLSNPFFDRLTDGTNAAIVTDAVATPVGRGVVMVGGNDGSNIRLIKTDSSGNVQVGGTVVAKIEDTAGNSLTSTSSALDVNLKSQTNAIKVSKSTSDNAVANPIFVELSDGTAAFGVTANPIFVNLKDGSGNALTSTSNKLDVGLTGANTVKLNDSAGTAITLSGANLKTSLFDSAGDPAVVADAVATPASRAVVMVGGNDGANIRLLATDSSGRLKTLTLDGSGNSITSTSNAMDVNLKSVTGTNVPITIAAQTLAAVEVSPTNAANTLANPFFNRLSDGTNAAIVTDAVASPVSRGVVMVGGNDGSNIRLFATDTSGRQKVVISDASGNALNSTSNALNVSLRDSAGTAITLNAGGSIKDTIYDAAGNTAVGTKGSAFPGTAGVVIVGGTDGTNTQAIATDTSGRVKVDSFDGSGNALTSTSSALDINIKSVTGTNLPISIAAQTLAAVAVSATNAANTVSNPIFTRLTDGTSAFGTSANPIFVDLKDGSGNALTSTTNKLNIALSDGAGTSISSTGGALPVTNRDASGNASVITKDAAVPATPGTQLISGSDGSNIRAIHTDTNGDVFTNLLDASNNTIAMQENTTVPGTQGGLMMSGWDGTKSHLVKTDANGFIQDNIVNRDGTRNETAFGQLKVAEENVINSANFAYQINPEDAQRYVEGPGTFSYVNGALHMDAGTAIGRVRIRSLRAMQYVAGVGVHAMISIACNDTGSAGCIRTWGTMDTLGLNGYYFQLNGTTLQIVRLSNGSATTVAAASWNIISTITPDTNFHTWEVLYQWLGSGRIIFRRDGKDVHSIEYAGTSSSLSTQNPDMVPWIDIQNTSTQGADRYIDLGCYHLSHENSNSRQAISLTSSSGTTAIPATLTSGTEVGFTAIQFRLTKGAASIANQGIAVIKRITISAQGQAPAGASASTMDITIRKNPLFGGSMAWTPNHHANDPNAEWNSAVQLVATVSGSSSTGAGYGTNVNLAYKITVLGAIGETIPSTASSTVSSGSPAKQINLTWSPVTYAAGYNIYRQNAGAGNFVFIGTTTGLSFTDNAFVASSAVPPGSSTAEGPSFMQAASAISSGASGYTASTGRTVFIMRLVANMFWTQEFASGKLVLYPGESLLVAALPNAAGLSGSAIVEWEEGPTVER